MSSFDKIAPNAKAFSASLMDLMDYVDGSVEQVIRKACIDLYRMIDERTPVKSGRAKMSWGIDTKHNSDVAPDNKDGYSFNEIQNAIESNVSGFKVGLHDNQVVIYNNLEYIENLEDGSSTQAPAGMVSLSLAEFTTHFNNALKGFKL